MKKIIPVLLLSIFCICSILGQAQDSTQGIKLREVEKIWDKAPHNAFTDLVFFKNRWFCVFREGSKHVSKDGALRVITSVDGKQWEWAAIITSLNSDLRDAKITITPNKQLMLSGAEALHDKTEFKHQSLAWFSEDGYNWSVEHKIGDPNFWLWRTTWHNNSAYNFGYSCSEIKQLRLYKSTDGINFDTFVEDLNIKGYPNESSIVFSGDTAFCLLRRDGEDNSGLLGTSLPPYTIWKWKDLGIRIGGPHMIQLPDGRFLAAVRLYETDEWHPARTSLCWVDTKEGKLHETLPLPSGGDTSYAGMVLRDGLLWVSYYSSHEGKTAIYLAKVHIENQSIQTK